MKGFLCSCSVLSNSFVIPWTLAHQAPLSMGFSREEYWSGLPCPPPGCFSDPGIELALPVSSVLAGGYVTGVSWTAQCGVGPGLHASELHVLCCCTKLLYWYFRAHVTKDHRLDGFNNRDLLSRRTRGYKCEIEVSCVASFRGLRGKYLFQDFLLSFRQPFSLWVS